MKNRFIFLILYLLRPFFPSQPKVGKILVVSTTGLGDTMWAIPALRALNGAGKKVFLLTGPYGNDLLKNCPYITRMFITSHTPFRHMISLFKQLRREQFEEIFVFHASQRPIFPLLSLLQCAALHGFTGINKGLDALFTHLIPKSTDHEIIYRLRMIGMENASPKMELFYPKERTDEKRIALFPGAKDPYKRWPAQYFIELGQKLAHHGYVIYILGAPYEETLVKEIAKGIPGAIPQYDLALSKTIQCIQTCSLVVTNDSGPMHLAFAADIPTIALFSPTASSKYGPLGVQHATIIERRTPCAPCISRKCRDNFCMRQISSETVYQEAKPWLT